MASSTVSISRQQMRADSRRALKEDKKKKKRVAESKDAILNSDPVLAQLGSKWEKLFQAAFSMFCQKAYSMSDRLLPHVLEAAKLDIVRILKTKLLMGRCQFALARYESSRETLESILMVKHDGIPSGHCGSLRYLASAYMIPVIFMISKSSNCEITKFRLATQASALYDSISTTSVPISEAVPISSFVPKQDILQCMRHVPLQVQCEFIRWLGRASTRYASDEELLISKMAEGDLKSTLKDQAKREERIRYVPPPPVPVDPSLEEAKQSERKQLELERAKLEALHEQPTPIVPATMVALSESSRGEMFHRVGRRRYRRLRAHKALQRGVNIRPGDSVDPRTRTRPLLPLKPEELYTDSESVYAVTEDEAKLTHSLHPLNVPAAPGTSGSSPASLPKSSKRNAAGARTRKTVHIEEIDTLLRLRTS